MFSLLSISIAALFASFISISLLRPFAIRVGLVDRPDLRRKRHLGAIPLVGGVSIYTAIVFSISLLPENGQRINLWLACSGILVVIGALDDKFDIPASSRLAIQIFVSLVMMIGTGISLTSLGNIFGFGEFQLGALSMPVTALAIVTAINAFNMVDGIDGLLGVHSLVSIGSIALLMTMGGGHPFLPLAIAIAGALIPYLLYNLCCTGHSGRKIFMGDAGSVLIGFAVVWLLIEATSSEIRSFRPITAVWLIAIPLMDLVSTFMRRIRKKRSPFKPDRTHLHHIFQRMGFSHKQTLLIISVTTTLMATIGVLGEVLGISELAMLFFFLFLFSCYEYTFGLHAWKLVKLKRRRDERKYLVGD